VKAGNRAMIALGKNKAKVKAIIGRRRDKINVAS